MMAEDNWLAFVMLAIVEIGPTNVIVPNKWTAKSTLEDEQALIIITSTSLPKASRRRCFYDLVGSYSLVSISISVLACP